jgi:hypothetical protein
METTAPPPPTDARLIAEQLATGLQVTFAAQGFRLEPKGAPLGWRTYVEVSALRTKSPARLVGCLRGWAA